jgi:hypothetical protein
MNGFDERGLNEDSFGASKGGISSFDAFRKFDLGFFCLSEAVGDNCVV